MQIPSPAIHHLAAAMADGSRARMLCVMMDGRAHTNKELASLAGIAPATASGHLTRLADAGLTLALRSGRHVYHRLATPEIAALLEQMAVIGPTPRQGCSEIHGARRCYNHLAGLLGVRITQSLTENGLVRIEGDAVLPGDTLNGFLAGIGLTDWRGAASSPVAKPCLDWTERRFHLSGPLATRMMMHFLDHDWLRPAPQSRALRITERGIAGFQRHFDLDCTTEGPTKGPTP